ncbi:MAG: phosphatidylserine decarboxylase [Flavobacteriales bacterium]|jgi:phosphatidylserine decarboxylase
MKDFLFISFQYIVPQHLLTRFVGKLASSQSVSLKNFLIKNFIAKFNVDMSEAAQEDYKEFSCFNDFFIRELKSGARAIESNPKILACPADGAVSQAQAIESGRIYQAKNHSYTTEELLGGQIEEASAFENGHFTTIYLSPKDYHRVHMPIDGTLKSVTYVPGQLFSVNPTTTENVPRLFSRNERAVFLFDTELGPMALIMVGAMIVASVETEWAGLIAPCSGKQINTSVEHAGLDFKKGEELGRFKLGSTVVMCFTENSLQWQKQFSPGQSVQMGEGIADLL